MLQFRSTVLFWKKRAVYSKKENREKKKGGKISNDL